MFQKKALWQGLTFVFTFLLSFAIVVAVLLETFRSAVDGAFGTLSEEIVSDENGSLYSTFTPDAKYLNADGTGNSTALIKDAIDIGRRFSAEGSVLLKNNNALPLAKGSKVTLLGARSESSIINAGMGQKSQGPYITLAQALSATKTDFAHTSTDTSYITTEYNFSDLKLGGNGVAAGAGFTVNDVVLEKYKELNTASKISLQPRPKQGNNIYNPLEPARSEVEPSVTASKANFGDAAIVVVGRPGAEGGDYLKGDVIEGLGYERPLQLTKNERDAIELATDNFDKVIVLVNTSSALEIGDLKKNDKIDAIMWIGHPGNYGFLGVADILCGNVSPSGGMSDIYATNNLSAPAMMNMGDYAYANASDVTRNANSRKYIMEAEGIYVGYRYYETRYYDSIVNPSSNAASSAGATQGSAWNYADEVTYGFGYGLSYANLKYELVGTPTLDRTSAKTGKESGHEIYVDFTVKVTNDSDVPSMANVQIYGQAPYIMGTTKVEKPAIQLLDYAKTKTIPARGSETVTVKVDLQNIASYDNTFANADGSKGTYILDEGDYYFAVGNGAHDALNNIMKAQNYTPDDANANAALAWKWTYKYAGAGNVDGNTFGVSKNNVKVQNQLEYADWNHFDPGKITYLSRTNWRDTYPVEYKNLTATAEMVKLLNGAYYTIRQDQDTSSFKWNSTATNIKFYEMALADFDDYRWEQMLSQMSIQESIVFAAYGGDALPAVPSVGLIEMQGTENMGNGLVYKLSATKDPSAPWAIKETDPAANWNGQVFCSAPLMAATFDQDLLYEEGVFVGTEALFLGVPILWGPGLNTHRHAYNGRNCDYYSEDPVLSGMCALGFSMGCRDKGLVAAPKHFAFNDQETNRSGVAPYLLEQRAREVELRAFQIAFEGTKYDRERGKDTGMIGLMTSFSKIGPVECTCSRELQTNICVKEWGFHGYAVTDIYDDLDLFTPMVYSGSTGFDMRGAKSITWDNIVKGSKVKKVQADGTSITEDLYDHDLDMMNALRASNKRYFWCIAQSNVMNRYNSSTHTVSNITWWRGTYIALIVVFSLLTAAGIVMFALSTVKGKKEA